MTDWRALYESWNQLPEQDKQLIEKLMMEKPKEKLADLFSREPYARMVYEKAVGKWEPEPAAGSIEKKPPESRLRACYESLVAVLLPVASLVSLLLAEIAYYTPSLTSFADKVLPLNLKVWVILLALASAFGSTSILYILRCLYRVNATQQSVNRQRRAYAK